MESFLHGLIHKIQRQHSPELRSFTFNEVKLTGYIDEHNMLQAMITLKKRQGVEIGLDQIMGLTLAFFIGISTLSTDSGHEYKYALVANKPLESHARSQLRCQRHVNHDKLQLRDDTETCIHHELGRQDRICS